MALNRRSTTARRRTPARAAAQPAADKQLEGPVLLSEVVASLLRSLVSARAAMDSASADLAAVYWADPIMRTLPLPAFGIPEVKVHLKFAVSNLVATGARPASLSPADMRIVIDLASLEKVPAHLISEIELRLTPQMVAVAETEAEETRRGRK